MLSLNGLALRIGSLEGLLALHVTVSLDLALCTTVNTYMAVQLDRRLGYSIPFYATAALASVLWPDLAMPIYGVGHFVGLSVLGISLAQRNSESKGET